MIAANDATTASVPAACPAGLEVFYDGRLVASPLNCGDNVTGCAAVGIVMDDNVHWSDPLISRTYFLWAFGSISQPMHTQATKAPITWAIMKPARLAGLMPEKVFVMDRAIATAGFAKEVEAVNQ